MNTIEIDTITKDIVLDPSGKTKLVDGEEALKSAIEECYMFWRGGWSLRPTLGVDWLGALELEQDDNLLFNGVKRELRKRSYIRRIENFRTNKEKRNIEIDLTASGFVGIVTI